MLDRVTEEVQLHSWHFNTDENYTLIADSNGYINLPNDVHQVSFPYKDSSYIKKGSRLYDKDLGTYKINKNVKANLIRILPFEDIPISFQYYIAIRAARKHQNNTLSSTTISSFQAQDEAEARLVCMKEEQRVRKPKIRYRLSDLFK